MTEIRRKMEAGFTLIEMMIVIAIIGILAAIAIPNFLKFQNKSKFSECLENLGKIRQLDQAFQAKYNKFAVTAAYPNAPCPPGAVKEVWPKPAGAFDLIGFAPGGAVFFSYGIIGGAPKAPAATGTTSANSACAAGTDSTLVFNASTSTTDVQNGLLPAAAGAVTLTFACTGDIDGDGTFGSNFSTDISSELIPDPVDAGANTF